MTDTPVLQVVSGDPTPEELAAIVVVLGSRTAPAPDEPAPSSTGWSAHWRRVRRPPLPGPGAWQASAWR
ncbi:acyl-CoA carboxylase subunit epsilon [Auraticoccus monumenti]|uniref:Acyl-CoA carboxylase epsilon subunit n=1 Tax=Auraticoccus monumenti TaxID=675864 RepID=A0A1G6XZL0_9ACTN|nr:acyl-CoA carboxylase subunit epsilon [Auraticoccus monumenti]SDD83608.1 Acyl-CoA carboxylase epsilon subunit [Auraticoccus monumenti]